MMIATWLVEIYLSKCNTLEDGQSLTCSLLFVSCAISLDLSFFISVLPQSLRLRLGHRMSRV